MIGSDAGALQGAGGTLAGEAAGVVPEAARRPLRELMDDRLLDALLERSRDQAGGLRLTGESSMLGELVRAVLEPPGLAAAVFMIPKTFYCAGSNKSS
jgi:hypothetical protein